MRITSTIDTNADLKLSKIHLHDTETIAVSVEVKKRAKKSYLKIPRYLLSFNFS